MKHPHGVRQHNTSNGGAKNVAPANVLFVATSDNQVRMFAGVIGALRRAGNVRVNVVSQDLYQGHNSEAAIRDLELPLIVVPRRSSHAPYYDCSPWQRVQFLREAKTAVREILRQQRPHVVIVGNDNPLVSNQFVHQAKGRGIPTLLIQDGFLAETKPGCGVAYRRAPGARTRSAAFRFLLNSLLGLPPRRRNGLNGCDRIAVMGNFARDMLGGLGVPEDRIAITGLPQFDAPGKSLESLSIQWRREYLSRRGIDPARPHAVFFSQPLMSFDGWPRDRWEQLLDLVASLARRHGNELSVSIKPHPRDVPADFAGVLQRSKAAGCPVTLLQDISAPDVLRVTDIAVVLFSTVTLEAMHMDIPIAWLNPFGQHDSFGLMARGAAVEVCSEEDWERVCRSYLHDEDCAARFCAARAQSLQDHVHNPNGKAADRIAEVILEMTARGSQLHVTNTRAA